MTIEYVGTNILLILALPIVVHLCEAVRGRNGSQPEGDC